MSGNCWRCLQSCNSGKRHYSWSLLDIKPSLISQIHSQLPSKHLFPRGRWDDGMWEKAPSVWRLSGSQLHSHGSKCRRRKNTKKIPAPLRRLSAIPAGTTHTTPACSQWWCSNLTDWAQGFVCLKPLTYFYSHCRSQSLYCVIAELMLHVYSKTGRNCLEKKKIWWRGIRDVCQMIQIFLYLTV